MATFDIADKACRLADNAREIAEIQKIIGDYNQGQIIDRQKAIEIINRLKIVLHFSRQYFFHVDLIYIHSIL